MSIDLLAGGTLGAWALRHAPVALVNQVVCLDDRLAALAAELGHTVFAGDPRSDAAFVSGAAALSVHFPLILDAQFIAGYDGAIWNLHPGLLPWGRGMYPVFWALWEGTPAGATLHELTVGLDEGPVVEQKRVAVLPSDTGGRLHERVQVAERELFMRWLARLATGKRPPATPQRPGGSYHTLAEFEHLRDEGRYEVPRADRERLARCLTFPDNPPLPVRNTP
jgi:methionyl-tRNA formyltransferase